MHEWKFDLRSATAGPLFRGRSLGSWLPFSFLCIGDDVTHFCYWDYLLREYGKTDIVSFCAHKCLFFNKHIINR